MKLLVKAHLTVAITVSTVLGANAQLSLDSSVISAGGGASSGGSYAITGTVGQPDVGQQQAGAGYALSGGFWGRVIQTPGAPLLLMKTVGGVLRVSWEDPEGSFVLQESSPPNALQAASWSDLSGPYSMDGNESYLEITSPSVSSFFRLRSP